MAFNKSLGWILAMFAVMFMGWLIVLVRGDFTNNDYSQLRKSLANHFLFSRIIEQRDRVKFLAKAHQLTFYEPVSFSNLAAMVRNPSADTTGLLEPYQAYYEKAAQWFPQYSELHGMLGFIYYYRGETEQSIQSYTQALRLNPQFFWFNYNLGLIYFKRKDYDQAVRLLSQALQTDKQKSVQTIYASSVYRHIFTPDEHFAGYSVSAHLEQEYEHCRRWLDLALRARASSGQKNYPQIKIYLF